MMASQNLLSAILLAVVAALSGCHWFLSAEDRIDRAEKHIASGNDRAAVIELKNALESDPNKIRARLLLADTSLRMGDLRATENEIALAEKSGAPAAQVAELTARLRLSQAAYQQLLDEIGSGKIALEEPGRSTFVGYAFRGLNRGEDALNSFQNALSFDANWIDARLGLTETFLMTGQMDRGLAEIDSILSADPTNALALMLKGSVLAARGEYRPAIELLTDARRNAPGQLPQARYFGLLATLVEAQIASGSLEASRSTHAELAKRAPDAPLTRLLAARIAMAAQDYTTAATEAQRVVSAAPGLDQAKVLLGAALLAQGSVNQAEHLLAELVQASPENVEARKLLAQANLRLNRPEIAAQVLAPLQQGSGDDAQFHTLLGWANLQQGNEAEAIALLEKSIAAQPENIQAKIDLASALLRGGESSKAIDLLHSMPDGSQRDLLLVAAIAANKGGAAALQEIDRIAASNPQNVRVLNTVAALYARYGRPDRARTLLERALEIEPTSTATLVTLARVEAAGRNTSAAQAALDKALAIEPKNVALLTARAELALQSQDTGTGERLLNQARAQDASAAAPRMLLARLYLHEKKTAEAEKIIAEALKNPDTSGRIHAEIGRIYLDAGRYEQALAHFTDAARLDANEPEHRLDMARAQLALGNKMGARESVDRAVRIRPTSVKANSMAVMLDLREGRAEAAAERVTRLKKEKPDDPAVAILEGDLALASKSFESAARAYGVAYRLSPSATAAVREYRARMLGRIASPTAPLEAWLDRQPQDATTRLVLADAYGSSGNAAKAIEQYEMLVRSESPNPMAMNNLAWLYAERGDDRSLELAARAYQAAPNVAAIADTYGWILVRSGRVQQALPILKEAAQASQSQPDIVYHYAFALAKSGDAAAARRELAAILDGGKDFASQGEARALLNELGA